MMAGMTDTTATSASLIQLNDGHSIPQLGIGTFQIPDDAVAEPVATAIAAGYRHIDTAAIYANERGVGEGIRASGVPRDELFVTTKLWNDRQGDIDSVRPALEESLERLGLEHVDLYLIHWPSPTQDRFVDAWRSLVQLRDEGLVRSVGVSNFHAMHLERAIDEVGAVPAANQIELHPYLQQRELRAEHERLGIATQSWSPLGQGGELLADDVIVRIADELGVTPGQVVIRWHLQHGLVTIPKSQNPGRIGQNFDVFGFDLTADQLAAIDSLDRGEAGRIGPNPETAKF
jgi:2,5-diketo-D-gluconate reductase A